MSYIPAKLLNCTLTISTSVSANSWNAIINVSPQPHSDATINGGFYNGNSVNVGDYVTTGNSGLALRIQAITSKNATIINCVLEDVDNINALMNPDQDNSGLIPNGAGVIFEIVDGLPVVYPLPNALPGSFNATFTAQLLARFQSTIRPFARSNHTHSFLDITNKPTTLVDYGITNAYTKSEIDLQIASINNVIKHSFQVNFDGAGAPSTITDLPIGWTSSINGNLVTVTHNINMMPFSIFYLGYSTGTGIASWRYRVPTAANEMLVEDSTKNSKFAFIINTSITAADLNGKALVNVSF